MANQGLYGQAQGNETRAAGRHNSQIMMAERLADNEIAEGDILADWLGYYKLGQWETLQAEVDRVRTEWLGQMPQGYEGGESKWHSDVMGRIESLITRATVGGSPGRE